MTYYIHTTSSDYYTREIFHVNPELCYFLLVNEKYYINKYANSKRLYKATPTNSKGKKLKQVVVDGGEYNSIGDSQRTNEKRSYSQNRTDNSLTHLMAETDNGEDLSNDKFRKVSFKKKIIKINYIYL